MRTEVLVLASWVVSGVSGAVLQHTDPSTLYFVSQAGENHLDVEDELVYEFQRKHPHINLFYSWEQKQVMKEDIQELLALKNGPDVVGWYAGGEVSRELITDGKLLNLHDLYEAEDLYSVFPRSLLKGISDEQGHPHMLPLDYYHWGVYYRKSVFEKLGISVPKTRDEFLNVCEQFKAVGITPITIGTQYKWPLGGWFDYLNMRMNGPQFHEQLTSGNVDFQSQGLRSVLDEWRQMMERGYFTSHERASTNTWNIMPHDLESERAGMALMGDFIRFNLEDESLMDDFAFFQFPIYNASVGVGEDAPMDGLAIARNSKHVDNAKEFMSYFASEEVQRKRINITSIPANVRALDAIKDPMVLKGAEMINDADYVFQFLDRDILPVMADFLMEELMNFFEAPNTIDDILVRCENMRQEVYFKVAPKPVMFPKSNMYREEVYVSLNSTHPDGNIFYTLDGSYPTIRSLEYDGNPISLTFQGKTVVRAITVVDNLRPSDPVQETYDIVVNQATEVVVSRAAGLASITMGLLGILYCCLLTGLICRYGDTPIFKASSTTFVHMIVGGVALALCTCIVMGVEPVMEGALSLKTASNLCMVPVWILNVSWAIVFGSLLSKTWRTIILFGQQIRKSKEYVTLKLHLCVLSILLIEVMVSVSWQTLDPMVKRMHVIPDSNTYAMICTSEHQSVWLLVVLLPKSVLLCVSIFACIYTRNFIQPFNESKRIAFAIYIIALLGGLALGLSIALKQVGVAYTIITLSIFLVCINAVSIIVLPLLYIVWFLPEKNDPKGWINEVAKKHSNMMTTT